MENNTASFSKKVQNSKCRNRKISVFLRRLYSLLQSRAHKKAIDWNTSGDAFVIINSREFAENVLPKLFNHGNLASFIRQLNMYNFVKQKDDNYSHVYSHGYFKKDSEDLLSKVERKKKYKKGNSDKKGSESEPTSKEEGQTSEESDNVNKTKSDLTQQLESIFSEISRANERNQKVMLNYQELKKEHEVLQMTFLNLKKMQNANFPGTNRVISAPKAASEMPNCSTNHMQYVAASYYNSQLNQSSAYNHNPYHLNNINPMVSQNMNQYTATQNFNDKAQHNPHLNVQRHQQNAIHTVPNGNQEQPQQFQANSNNNIHMDYKQEFNPQNGAPAMLPDNYTDPNQNQSQMFENFIRNAEMNRDKAFNPAFNFNNFDPLQGYNYNPEAFQAPDGGYRLMQG